jgi:hypothetical protein
MIVQHMPLLCKEGFFCFLFVFVYMLKPHKTWYLNSCSYWVHVFPVFTVKCQEHIKRVSDQL